MFFFFLDTFSFTQFALEAFNEEKTSSIKIGNKELTKLHIRQIMFLHSSVKKQTVRNSIYQRCFYSLL